jgi:hypothetical protein
LSEDIASMSSTDEPGADSTCFSSSSAVMTSNLDFTDKASQSVNDAVQLAKDHANAHGTFQTSILSLAF